MTNSVGSARLRSPPAQAAEANSTAGIASDIARVFMENSDDCGVVRLATDRFLSALPCANAAFVQVDAAREPVPKVDVAWSRGRWFASPAFVVPQESHMAHQLTLYTNPMSRGRIVRWMLEEVGRPYATVLLDFGTTMKAPDYLAVNPMGKVPALRHGDTVVTEAGAICAYLADAFPEAGLAPPPGDPARGSYYRWLFFAAGPVEAAVTNRSLGIEVPPEQKGRVGYGSLADVLATLEVAVMSGDYLAGNRFSAADVYLGAQIGWGMMFGAIEKRPAFERYWERIRDRPAAFRARQIDDALLPKKQ
jgi:glutathione S-transferase